MAIINSTDENFEKLKSENKIFLAKMTASWCQPCKMLNPVLEEISEEMKDQLVIANHDIDSEPNVPTRKAARLPRYGRRSAPECPGSIRLTWMPLPCSSIRIVTVRPSSANFEAV